MPAPVSLRVYLVAIDGTYKVMPGGLTRVAADGGLHAVSMQYGGASKDTWLLERSAGRAGLAAASVRGAIELRRVGNNLPSRLADNFFWLGRYAERADAAARLLRSALDAIQSGKHRPRRDAADAYFAHAPIARPGGVGAPESRLRPAGVWKRGCWR